MLILLNLNPKRISLKRWNHRYNQEDFCIVIENGFELII